MYFNSCNTSEKDELGVYCSGEYLPGMYEALYSNPAPGFKHKWLLRSETDFLSVTPFGIICQMTFHINLQLYFAYLLSLPVKKPVSCCHIWAIWTSLSTPTCTEVSPFFDTVDRGLGIWHSGWVLAAAQQKLWVLLPAPRADFQLFQGTWRPLLASSDISHIHLKHSCR